MQTLEEIRREGLDALEQRLSRVGMVRFLQLFETGSGDYVLDRREFVKNTTLDSIRKQAAPPKSQKKPRRRN
jgi:hypothetical protein